MWKELKVALDFIRPWVNLPIICQNTKYHLHLCLYIYNLFCRENIIATLAQGDWKGSTLYLCYLTAEVHGKATLPVC